MLQEKGKKVASIEKYSFQFQANTKKWILSLKKSGCKYRSCYILSEWRYEKIVHGKFVRKCLNNLKKLKITSFQEISVFLSSLLFKRL